MRKDVDAHQEMLFYERFYDPNWEEHEVQITTYADYLCVAIINYETGTVTAHLDVPHQP